ncbi:MAG: CHAT domain-containing protein [Ilumatobacteraceae bacterium]
MGIHLRTITGAAARALAALGSGDLMRVAPISRSAVNEVGRLALPDSLVDAISNSGDSHLTLMVVPDAATWAISWSVIAHPETGSLLERCDISVTSSVHTLRTRPQRAHTSTGAVQALIDRRIPAGAALESRLARFTTTSTTVDIQVVYGHGGGQDLEYGIDTGGELADAFSVDPAEIVILASCRSGTRSPAPMPLGLVSATMLRGAATVIAGLWDLPTDSTARVTGDIVELLLAGNSPASALRQATDGLDLPWPNWAGLGVFGWA